MGALGLATSIKIDSNTSFPVKFAKILRTPLWKNSCGRLLLISSHIHMIGKFQ